MPTEVVTPQMKTELNSGLAAIAPYFYNWGGKYKTAFQEIHELCMTKLAENLGVDPSASRSRTRKPRAAASTPSAVEEIDAPKRRRGRPAGSTNAAKRSTTRTSSTLASATARNAAILKTIAAGYSTQAAMLPELKRAYDIVIRPNHLGICLSNLRKAGELMQDGSAWSITSAGRQMLAAA